MTDSKIEKIQNAPNGFCLAKWYQVTIDLSRGNTHSCHHPLRHKIPLEELKKDPSALHNTHFKMLQRKMMLEGIRPPECNYCWRIEDTPGEHYSDRMIKSTDDWAFDKLDETLNMAWDEKVSPTYLEVIFSSECNLNCSYCMADISTSIEREMDKFGPYKVKNSKDQRVLKESEIKSENPYVQAFWLWFPEIIQNLKVFRISGGEPFLSKDTFLVFDFIEKNPAPNLEIAINTNLSYSSIQLQKVIAPVKVLLAKKAIKSFTFFTSLDGFNEEAVYIRKGLDLKKFRDNINIIHNSLPESEIILMCTYNILSINSFKNLLDWVADLKSCGMKIKLDISYLREPVYLSANLATDDLILIMSKDLHKMKSSSHFTNYEVKKFERIVSWIKSSRITEETHSIRSDFYIFINEFDRRFKGDFLSTFSNYDSFFKTCKKAFIWQKIQDKNA